MVTAIIRFVNINPASGEVIALSKDRFWQLLYLVFVIICLDIEMWERRRHMRHRRIKCAEKRWREEAEQNAK